MIQMIAAIPLGSCTISRHSPIWGRTAIADFSYFSNKSVHKEQWIRVIIKRPQPDRWIYFTAVIICLKWCINLSNRNSEKSILKWTKMTQISNNYANALSRHKEAMMAIQSPLPVWKTLLPVLLIKGEKTAFTSDDNQCLWWNVLDFPGEKGQ